MIPSSVQLIAARGLVDNRSRAAMHCQVSLHFSISAKRTSSSTLIEAMINSALRSPRQQTASCPRAPRCRHPLLDTGRQRYWLRSQSPLSSCKRERCRRSRGDFRQPRRLSALRYCRQPVKPARQRVVDAIWRELSRLRPICSAMGTTSAIERPTPSYSLREWRWRASPARRFRARHRDHIPNHPLSSARTFSIGLLSRQKLVATSSNSICSSVVPMVPRLSILCLSGQRVFGRPSACSPIIFF